MKRGRAVILCVLFAVASLCISPTAAFALQTESIEPTQLQDSSTYYSFDSVTKTLTISGTGAMPDFTNSSGADTSQPWFAWRSDDSIEHVVVEEGVTALGAYCFYNISSADISLPSTLTSLANYAMSGMNSVTSFTVPAGVTSIPNSFMYQCTGLTQLNIHSGVTSVGQAAFSGCTALSQVTFGSDYMSISLGRSAFLKCTNLHSITVPKNATLSAYSLGYKKASSGSTDANVTLRVYRDSAAYTYANTNAINYTLVNTMTISEGDTVGRTYYSDNINDYYTFLFTPSVTARYTFYSEGSVDVVCSAVDSNNGIVAYCDDISQYDLNFSITASLTAGETYSLIVTSTNSVGDFDVTLMPVDIAGISADWDTSVSAADLSDFNADDYVEGKALGVIYTSGYVKNITFENLDYFSGLRMVFNSASLDLECGDNSADVYLGGFSDSFNIRVNHSVTVNEVVAPTIENDGYTSYTCTVCGETFNADYTDRLGTAVTGRVTVMASPDGTTLAGSYLAGIPIYNQQLVQVATTDSSGYFTYNNAYQFIVIGSPYGAERAVTITHGEGALGDIPVVNCDIVSDGYINAKDFAEFKKLVGSGIDLTQYPEYTPLDTNRSGALDMGDWSYAEAFYAAGLADGTIYN